MRNLSIVLLIVLAVFLVLYVTLIARRRLAQRTTMVVPVPPEVPIEIRTRAEQIGSVRCGPLEAVYVSTTLHGDWLARVGAHGLGDRSRAYVTVWDSGVLIEREGIRDLWIPAVAIGDVGLAPGMAGKYVGTDGLVMLTWTVPEAEGVVAAEVDTGLRTRRPQDRSSLVDAVRHLSAIHPTNQQEAR